LLTTDEKIEAIHAAMRNIGDKAVYYLETYYRLATRNGEIAVGGEHFDALVKSEALFEFLHHLRRSCTPEEAATNAKEHIAGMVDKWNKNPQAVSLGGQPYQLHRWIGMADAIIEDAMRQVLKAARGW